LCVNDCILYFTDNHEPYSHKHSPDFIKAVADKFAPTRIIQGGDFADNQGTNLHAPNPGLPSVVDELSAFHVKAKQYYDYFPKVDLIRGNHETNILRRAIKNGIPEIMLKSLNDIYQMPEGWTYHDDLTLDVNGEKIYFCHGKSSGYVTTSNAEGISCVSGHFHSKFAVIYTAGTNTKRFNCFGGCLIDDKQISFTYNKATSNRPILGCVVIIRGVPVLIPMHLTPSGNWTGRF
jgi:hypothetical protein